MNKIPSIYTQISTPVLQTLKEKFNNYGGSPFCYVEISHRSKYYDALNVETMDLIKQYFHADDYEVFLLPTGAAMASVFSNLVVPETQMIFYSEGSFSSKFFKEMKKYHECTLEVNSTEGLQSYLETSNPEIPKILHYNRIEDGKLIQPPLLTESIPKNWLIIKNINYCFSEIHEEPTEDLIYFESETGFSIPGFTVVLMKKTLFSTLPLKENCPDMIDYVQMKKMKSVVNTPYTLCTFILNENLKFFINNRDSLIKVLQTNKENYYKFLTDLGYKRVQQKQEKEALSFIRINGGEKLGEMTKVLKNYGFVDQISNSVYIFIQSENSSTEQMATEIKPICEQNQTLE